MQQEKKARRLGRGLSALLNEAVAVTAPVEVSSAAAATPTAGTPEATPAGVASIEVSRIVANRFQPRTTFDEASLQRLADSVRRSGVMQPVVVRPVVGGGGGERYELVAGERRWRAAAMAGLERIPAVVQELTDEEAAEWALVENLQREDLNPMERAFAFRTLAERFGLSHAEIAARVGLDRSTVANLVRLTELEEPVREMIASGRLTPGHGKALLATPAGPARIRLAEEAATGDWSVRRLERAVQRPARASAAKAVRVTHGGDEGAKAAALADLEKQLGDHLGTRVKIVTDGTGTRGRVMIEFYGLDHFDGLLARLGFAPR